MNKEQIDALVDNGYINRAVFEEKMMNQTDAFIRQQLAHRLMMMRAFKKLSQQDLAEMAGMKRGTLGNIELARQGTTITQLVKLCSALDIELYLLFAPAAQWQDAMKGYL